MRAAAACGDPFDEQQRALGIRHSTASDDKVVNALSREAEQPRELRLLAIATEQRPRGCDECIPQRSVGAGAKGCTQVRSCAFAIGARDVANGLARDGRQTIGGEEYWIKASQGLHEAVAGLSGKCHLLGDTTNEISTGRSSNRVRGDDRRNSTGSD
jgi:hypothetical protein